MVMAPWEESNPTGHGSGRKEVIHLQIMSSLKKTDGYTAYEGSGRRLKKKAIEEEEPGRWAMDGKTCPSPTRGFLDDAKNRNLHGDAGFLPAGMCILSWF